MNDEAESQVGERLDDGRIIGQCDYCEDEGIFPKRVRSMKGGRIQTMDLPGDLTKLSNGLVRCDSCEVDAEIRYAEQRGKRRAS